MLPQNNPDRIRILFDDHRLVANAGLNRPMKGLERHTRQRVRRLKAVASIVHSAATLTRPRSRKPTCPLLFLDDSEDWLDQLLSQLVRLSGR